MTNEEVMQGVMALNSVRLYLEKENEKKDQKIHELTEALREIDTHIRSTSEPIPYIIQTLKEHLPEYKHP